MQTNTKYEIIEIDNKEVTFDVSNLASSKSLYINATQIAKEFNKQPKEWLRLKETKEYIQAVQDEYFPLENSQRENSPFDLYNVVKGGNHSGTWIHNLLAIRFMQWLNPTFAVKCDKKIKEILEGNIQPTQTTDLNPLIEVLTKSIEMQNNRFNHLEQEIVETKAMMSTIKENSSKFVKIEKSNEAIEQYIKQQPIDADQVFMLRQAVDDRAMELAKKYNIHSRICKDFIYSELRGIFEVRSYIEIKRAAFKNALFRVNRMDMQSYIQIDFPGIGIVNPKKDIADEEQE